MNYARSVVDVGLAPVARIFQEASLARLPNTHVVRDREPICHDHFLTLPAASAHSFADLAHDAPIITPNEVALALGLEHWLWFEKGRAEFCTSMQTEAHAHAHLLPSIAFSSDTVLALATEVRATPFGDFRAALASAATQPGTYLLFGSDVGDWFLLQPPSKILLEKRFIRRYLTARLVAR